MHFPWHTGTPHQQLFPTNLSSLTRVIIQFSRTFCWELVSLDISVVDLHAKSIVPFYLWCMLGGGEEQPILVHTGLNSL